MQSDAVSRSPQDWEIFIGEQVKALRIREDITQEALAMKANVSLGAVRNIETGKGSTLTTLIKIVRALDMTDWLEALQPASTVDPLAFFDRKNMQRSRVRLKNSEK